jgi:hypothetical protein
MYDTFVTSIQTSNEDTYDFPMNKMLKNCSITIELELDKRVKLATHVLEPFIFRYSSFIAFLC